MSKQYCSTEEEAVTSGASIYVQVGEQPQWPVSSIGFSGGERHIQLKQMPINPPASITLRADIHSSNSIMDLLLTVNAINHYYDTPVAISLEIPYLPYARQDRVCAEGQAFSLEVMAGLLKGIKAKRLITWDCHSQVGIELTGATNVPPTDIIRSHTPLLDLLKAPNTVLVCPDKGAVNRCTALRNDLGLAGMVLCEKRRDPATGRITHTDVLADDLTGKTAVITDDICDGGFTFIKIAEQLKTKNVERVVLFVTHGIFSKGLAVFDGLIDQVFTTNSFPQQQDKRLNVIDFSYQF